MCTTPLTLKKAINITFTLYLNCLTFLGLGDVVLFHLRLCLLVSGLYSNIHDSSLVTTPSTSPVQFLVVPGCHDALKHAALFGPCSTNVGPFWHRSFSSPSLPNDCLYSCLRNDCLYSFVYTLYQFICYHLNSQPTVATHFLPYKFNVLLVEGFLLLGSSSTSSLPALNLLCPLKTHALGIALFP